MYKYKRHSCDTIRSAEHHPYKHLGRCLSCPAEQVPYNNVRTRFPHLADSGLDLLDCLMAPDPANRLNAIDRRLRPRRGARCEGEDGVMMREDRFLRLVLFLLSSQPYRQLYPICV
jgi:hypothetical protein